MGARAAVVPGGGIEGHHPCLGVGEVPPLGLRREGREPGGGHRSLGWVVTLLVQWAVPLLLLMLMLMLLSVVLEEAGMLECRVISVGVDHRGRVRGGRPWRPLAGPVLWAIPHQMRHPLLA